MTARLPLGIRSNNPGNLRPGAKRWEGETTPPGAAYCSFDTPENGLRAMGKNLLAYQQNRNIRNVERIVSRWAPSNENNTEAYIVAVCARTGFKRHEVLDVTQPDTLRKLVVALTWHENGMQPYADAVIDEGVRRALA